jgi:threonine synthase
LQSYEPQKTVETLSNAMDVSNPSNFVRILELFGNEFGKLDSELTSYPFTDAQTVATLKKLYTESGYLADPHGAVGYLGLKKFMDANPGYTGVFLETAHPVKFADSITQNLNIEIEIPQQIQAVLNGEKKADKISSYEELKAFLLDN